MPKKSNVKPLKPQKESDFFGISDGVQAEFVYDVIGGMMQHATETSRAEQVTALELTKLALNHTKNADTETVFELFRRSAAEVNDLYGSSIMDGEF